MNRYEFSFMHDGAIQKFAFRSDEPNIELVRSRVNACDGPNELRQMQFIPINEATGTATELLATLTEALVYSMEEDEAATAAAADLRTRAEHIDERASTAKKLKPWEIEFIWDNGGDDDNPFQDGFLAASKDPDAVQWILDLGEWIDENGFGYDVATRQLGAVKSLPTAYEALGDALVFIKAHAPEATQLATLLQWAVLERGLGQTPVPQAPPKTRM